MNPLSGAILISLGVISAMTGEIWAQNAPISFRCSVSGKTEYAGLVQRHLCKSLKEHLHSKTQVDIEATNGIKPSGRWVEVTAQVKTSTLVVARAAWGRNRHELGQTADFEAGITDADINVDMVSDLARALAAAIPEDF